MATDIAKIGFGVETSQLEKGVATLNTFSASAKSANNSAKSVGTAMNSAAKVFAGAVAGMSRSIASLVSVTQGATAEQITAAKEASEFADRVYRAAQAQDKLAASTQKVTTAIKGQTTTLQKQFSIQQRIERLTGVTGLSGGSAFASYNVFKREMSKREWNEATGSLSRDLMPNGFNTANIAAQFQDIGVTAAMGMNPLLIALQQGTQLAAVMNSMEAPLKGLKEAFVQIINPVSLLSIGLTALAVVGLQMVDWTGLAQGSLNSLASVMDFVVDNSDTFLAALTGISTALVAFKGQAIFTGLVSGFKSVLTILTGLTGVIAAVLTSPITLTIAAVTGLIVVFTNFKDEINGFFGFDFVESVKTGVNKAIGFFVGMFEMILEGLTWIGKKFASLFSDDFNPEKGFLETMKDTSSNALNRDYLGIASDTISSTASSISSKLKEWSNGLNETTESTESTDKLRESWERLQNQVNQDISGLQLDKKLVGVDTYISTYEKTKADLMNQATNDGINLTPEKIAYIDEAADKIARLKDENEKLTDSFNTAKSVTGSFFQDMRESLWEGQTAWESFANAVTNLLDNVLGKLLDFGVNNLFDSLGAIGTSGGTKDFSWGNIVSSIGSWFSGTPTPAPAANGGAFTNGVYNSPTLFKFANGGQFGVMGEAGPEAVMPLRRGPDGSLGVQADGVGQDVIVNVYNNSNAQASVNRRETSQGTEIDIMIDQLVAQKLSKPGTATNSSALALNNRKLINR